tara:strand:- start:989 stop:2188 length:1200 start_codon:yes stop_codon:yes gene_type:complete
MKKILYISHDGIFDHIGKSQILPYLLRNSEFYKFHLITFEKQKYSKKFLNKKNFLLKFGINWYPQIYHTSLIGKFFDFVKIFFYTFFFKFFFSIKLVHCRSYIPSFSLFLINKITKIAFIFDIRDFWADEGLEIKKYKLIYKIIKKIEGHIINDAYHVVCLTNAAKKYIINLYSKKYSNIDDKKISIIPCGTDFDLFNPKILNKRVSSKIRQSLKLKNKKVLLYYGSIGQNYLLDKKILFFKTININNDWIFLFIVNNELNYLQNYLVENGINKKNFIIVNLQRNMIPYYLNLANLSIFFYRKGMRSLGCSPTKLADLFSMNVPIITDSSLGDMNEIIKYHLNKSKLLHIFNKHQIRTKTNIILNEKKYIDIRGNSKYFDYKIGCKKYLKIYNQSFIIN